MFRLTRSYLLLVKPTIFSGFLEKIVLCILKDEMPFKMHKFIFFPEKICDYLPYLKFSGPLPETHLSLFLFDLMILNHGMQFIVFLRSAI